MNNPSSRHHSDYSDTVSAEFRRKAHEAIFTIATSPVHSIREIAAMAAESLSAIVHADTVAILQQTAEGISPLVQFHDGELHFDTEELLISNIPIPDSVACRSESGDNRADGTIALKDSTSEITGYICAERDSKTTFNKEEQEALKIFGLYISREIEKNNIFEQSLCLQKKKILSQITSDVAHEIRNPLNALAAVSEALFSKIDDNAVYGKYKEHLRNQIRRLSHITDNIQGDDGTPGPPC